MKSKIILTILILSMIALIFSGCIGGSVTPPIPDNTDDSNDTEIPEPTEAIFQFGKLVLGGISCHLVWKDNSDNEAGFRIERRLYPPPFQLPDPDVHHADFRLVIVVGPDVQTYTDVVPLAAFPEYRVAAIAADGRLSEWTTFLWSEVTCPEEPSLTPEEIELIRKWGYGGDYVVRWPDGYVDVYDETNYSQMQEVLNQWNEAIGGPVILRLSSNPNSPVKVIFDSSLDEENLCGSANEIWGDDYAFSEITIKVNPSESCCGSYNIKYCLYLVEFNAVAGFNYAAEVSPVPFEDWSNFSTIPDTIKTMVRALYKVPPGYYLGSNKLWMNHSDIIIENMPISVEGNYLDKGRK